MEEEKRKLEVEKEAKETLEEEEGEEENCSVTEALGCPLQS